LIGLTLPAQSINPSFATKNRLLSPFELELEKSIILNVSALDYLKLNQIKVTPELAYFVCVSANYISLESLINVDFKTNKQKKMNCQFFNSTKELQKWPRK